MKTKKSNKKGNNLNTENLTLLKTTTVSDTSSLVLESKKTNEVITNFKSADTSKVVNNEAVCPHYSYCQYRLQSHSERFYKSHCYGQWRLCSGVYHEHLNR